MLIMHSFSVSVQQCHDQGMRHLVWSGREPSKLLQSWSWLSMDSVPSFVDVAQFPHLHEHNAGICGGAMATTAARHDCIPVSLK